MAIENACFVGIGQIFKPSTTETSQQHQQQYSTISTIISRLFYGENKWSIEEAVLAHHRMTSHSIINLFGMLMRWC
jgi:hypothetical protein